MPTKSPTKEQRARWNRAYYEKGGKAKVSSHRDEQRRKLREAINAAKGFPCTDCGVEYPPYVMDFDHTDPSTKVSAVCDMVRKGVSMTTLLAEIDKCELVCANCHRERTHGCEADTA